MLQEREEKNDIISHAEPSVSILFCDIQEFSDLMAHLSPIDLVATLNVVYSAFDVCSERFGVQKMETVGKTYMVCVFKSALLLFDRVLTYFLL
jgi:class 3 adenylate cyclase